MNGRKPRAATRFAPINREVKTTRCAFRRRATHKAPYGRAPAWKPSENVATAAALARLRSLHTAAQEASVEGFREVGHDRQARAARRRHCIWIGIRRGPCQPGAGAIVSRQAD